MSVVMENLSIEQVLDRLVKQISFLAFKFHKSLKCSIDDAKQTARVAVLEIYNKNPTYQDLESFYFTAINNYFINEIRRLRTKKATFIIVNEFSNLALSHENVAEELITEDYISDLDPEKQAIVRMLLKGHTFREISAKLDIPLGSCYRLLEEIRNACSNGHRNNGS